MVFFTTSRHAAVDSMAGHISYLETASPFCNHFLLAGEICTDWQSWGQYLNIQVIVAQSLLHSFVYVAFAVRSLDFTFVWLFPILMHSG